jgi:acetoin:2,6-dichlorophenolindophenol oxidoreductase subunit alpha
MSSPGAVQSEELTVEQIADRYRTMRTIREFEERVHKHFAIGDIPGFVHLYAGEEAIAVGVCSELGDADYIASTHRGHGHAIAKGCDVKLMMAELFARRTGLCKGKGGSMHIADLDRGMLGANGIVGGGIPLVVGVGLSAKVRETEQVGVVFLGDGATNEGTFAESLNLAAVWKAPTIFVIENNGYAESTGTSFALSGVEPHTRAVGYGVPGVKVDGTDYFAVQAATREALARARRGEGPSVIECQAGRFYGHFEGDTQTYRAPGEIDDLKANHDPLKIFRAATADTGLGDELVAQIDAEVIALLDAAIAEASAAPQPGPRELMTDIYASY